jgi:hypothetical protein
LSVESESCMHHIHTCIPPTVCHETEKNYFVFLSAKILQFNETTDGLESYSITSAPATMTGLFGSTNEQVLWKASDWSKPAVHRIKYEMRKRGQ